MSNGALGRRLVSPDSPDAAEIIRLSTIVGERLAARSDELSESMTTAIENGLEELNDPDLLELLRASVAANIATILHMIRNNIPLDQAPPVTAATEYADRLGQRGIPASSLRRAYHFGSDDLLANVFEEVRELDTSPELRLRVLHHFSGWLHKYVDWITRVVLDVHEEGRRYSVEQNATVVSTMVRRALQGDLTSTDEFTVRTGYPLTRTHLAATLWIDRANPGTDNTALLESLAHDVATTLGSRAPLFTSVDRSTAWVWYPVADADPEVVRPVLSVVPGARMAFGSPAPGLEGFRESHQQAESVKHVAAVSTNQAMTVVGHGSGGMSIIAMLARDLPGTRRWVRDVLGPLAADTEAAERLRDTARVFLDCGNSYVATAEALNMHRNTVKYRLGRVVEELGHPIGERRLDTELALHTAHVLGAAVL
ncbi:MULTISPECIES: PucR family transcriptional regulator [Gordonia]|uniref:Helix-turn-helix domain-containing protein n=1 Tax=Gordonia amicalis TaxID=89053 RepID=A0AAE4R1E4_9ACTN|nr:MULTISPECIES: helix-turn-helix domain-containing protein [Gordonia]ATD72166.1 polyketide synthase regulator [Gordonia sp. 1D]MBA5847254.1 helix-turn-helix domain-containing protein [Gordonia amicalis]MCR8895840.1 helix-turn-helix domain-containing protein [Gordonia sp. GONU]MCZ0914715.1 helix-turn-helix domain-containing protein [Gordonia amicalis]MCZ4578764.1 helix-turn-helix domain-containing protein [Gordonia amicalis]